VCAEAVYKQIPNIRRWKTTTHKLTRNEFEWDAYVIKLKLTAVTWEKSSRVSRDSAFSHSLCPLQTIAAPKSELSRCRVANARSNRRHRSGSPDHLIRLQQDRLRDSDAEGFRGLEVDHQLKLVRLLNR
jgi:hypothetical protein